ncbi:hypothetical protein RE474_12995 [Methanolobus sediminis]|uniref:Uncharacterized protein n=1 Tax=Methanolobus sediminis TaxID=3072978 RepID=A0AA51UKC7_9EURY|nr:hypothetical protein [Methanolobus sediminis]WMW24979.1 hypothetical protein RE474_12995 [Methanolobus sediminis]
MRVDTKGQKSKKLIPIIAIFVVLILFSSQSMAEVVDQLKVEINEHDILGPFDSTISEKDTSIKSSNTYNSGSNSGHSTGSHATYTASSSDTSSSQVTKGTVNTDLFTLLKKYTEYYNSGIDEVPGIVKNIAGNDLILLEIAMNDNSELRIKVCTEDGLITEFSKLSSGEKIDPTVTLTSNENTIRTIIKSDDPLGYFITSLNQGLINIECKGFIKKAALSTLKALG